MEIMDLSVAVYMFGAFPPRLNSPFIPTCHRQIQIVQRNTKPAESQSLLNSKFIRVTYTEGHQIAEFVPISF